uniref:Serine/threonine protein kinase n=1 Tax=Pfiesteria piscicida TaxID=71001 RepID=A3E3J0_PFIPI|nr:serine/threonine protein kinase [Pfiesteria piscicida]
MLRVVSIASGSGHGDGEVVELSSDEDVAPLAPLWGPVVCPGAPPLRFRSYQRGRELGSGGFGRVFLCSQEGSAGQFAVKTVDLRRLKLRADGKQARVQLEREVEILKSLPCHRNVVRMFDAFEKGNWFFIILELVEQGDLFTALTSRHPSRFADVEALHVIGQVVTGLSFLHSHMIIHRDVKLENVLVSGSERRANKVYYDIKLTDFGLSKMVGTNRSETHSCVGTKPYMAPEVVRRSLTYDFSSDLWGVGVLLFVMVAGKFPFDDTPADQSVVDAVLDRSRTGGLKGILLGLLQVKPEERVSMATLLDWHQGQSAREASRSPPRKRHREEAASCSEDSDLGGHPVQAESAAPTALTT